jgi:hypothetical protein
VPGIEFLCKFIVEKGLCVIALWRKPVKLAVLHVLAKWLWDFFFTFDFAGLKLFLRDLRFLAASS